MASSPSGNFGVSIEQRVNPSIALRQQLADYLLEKIRVALPGQVQAFYPGPPATVDVLIATNEFDMSNVGGDVVQLQTQATQLPLLNRIPVQILGAGGCSLTFPIQQGDECWVMFADTPLSIWFQNGGVNNAPISQRRHSLSDGVALFGLRSTPRALQNYSTSKTQLRTDDGQTVISLSAGEIDIQTTLTINVNAGFYGTVNVSGENVNVNDTQNVTIYGSSTVNVSGGSVEITGTTQLVLSALGNTEIENRTFLNHVHKGVQPGTGTTGPVL